MRTFAIIRSAACSLVMSAIHMPRARWLFESYRMRSIPAPVDYLQTTGGGSSPGRFFPRAEGLVKVEAALNEVLELMWGKTRSVFR